MLELLQMWALVEVLGFLCLPLTMTVFHNLPDRGWAFSKALGMAVLAFSVWFPLMCFHVLPFSQLFILGTLLVLFAFSIVGFLRTRQTLVKVLRANFTYILVTEVLFLGMVFLLGWLRSYTPDIQSFEMFMDEGFISAIMRSPHFPPSDMWLSGYSINYYYYAHFTIAALAKLLGQSPSVAFNTGISIFFGVTAINLFGVTCNIVTWARQWRSQRGVVAEEDVARPDTVYPALWPAIPYGFLTMIMGLVLGNLAATQQWFQIHGDASQFDWFAPSRVVDKTINEFPAFSFLLSCFHAHVLALAFTIVAIAMAFNLFLEADGRGLFVFGRGWRLPFTLGATALVIGALFTMNGWDLPTYLGLALVCIILQQWLAHRSDPDGTLLRDIFLAGAALTVLSLLLYAPFYLSFNSPAQGIGLVGPGDRSQFGSEILIYGMFAFVFVSLLVISIIKLPFWKRFGGAGEGGNGSSGDGRPFWLSKEILSAYIIGLVALLALIFLRNSTTFVVAGVIAALGAVLVLSHLRDRSLAFVLLLGTLAFTLIAGCEIFFLRDAFAGNFPRMNTVFKFYFQSWALLSITSGAGLFFILEGFRPAALVESLQRWLQWGSQVVWTAAFCLLLLAGTVYPLAGAYARTNHYTERTNSLDGLSYMQTSSPGDYAAIRWLNSNVSGNPVIVESIGPDYSMNGRVSAFTGLPTLMGWVGHEYQWRLNWLNNDLNALDFNRRSGDVDTIYTDTRPDVVRTLLARYQVAYIYVGPLELAKYPKVNLDHFSSFLQVAYNAKGVTIYKVTG